MSARAIQDRKAPETFVQQAVQGKADVAAGAHQGSTIATTGMRPDVLDSWRKETVGRATRRGVRPRKCSQVLSKPAAIGDPGTTTISPNCVQGKGRIIFIGSSLSRLYLR